MGVHVHNQFEKKAKFPNKKHRKDVVEAMVNDGIMLNPNHFRYKLFSGRIKRKINVTRKIMLQNPWI